MRRGVYVILAIVLAAGVVLAASGSRTTGTAFVYADDAPHVGIEGGRTMNLTYLGPQGTTHANLTNAGILYADGDDTATMVVPSTESLDDSQIRVEQIDLSGTVGLETPGTQRIVIGGNIDNVTWKTASAVALDDGVVDFAYGGPSGTSIVELSGVPANTAVRAVDAQTGQTLDLATSDGSGRINFTSLSNSEHDVLLQKADAPTLSNPVPDGGLSQDPEYLNVTVTDRDFPADTVDVSFELDGSSVGTTTIEDNGTASLSMPQRGKTGGEHTVNVTATDSAGNTTTLNYSYKVPSVLTIYNESNASEVLDNVTVEITAYYETGGTAESITRSTSDGTLNLTGFPVNRPLVISANADGFRDRRIFLEDIYEQSSLYLLPENRTYTKVVFELRDFTGDYPQDVTVLQIQRSLNGSYQTVFGDYFGANNQFPATLAYNERHRLRLLNTETGQTRSLGTYTPLSSNEEVLQVSTTGNYNRTYAAPSLSISPSARNLPAKSVTLDITLSEYTTAVENYDMTVYYVDGGTNNSLYSTSNLSTTANLNLSGKAGGQVKVVASWTSDGLASNDVATFGVVKDRDGTFTLLGGIAALLALLPGASQSPFMTATAVVMTLVGTTMTAARLRLSSEMVGGVAVAFLLGFGIVGWIGYDLVFTALVAWGALTFIRRAL